MKLCTVCGVATSRHGSRCTEHARQSARSRHNALYSTRSWQRLSARVLRAWRGQHGNWCPGYQRDAHRASDLTVDHVVPLAAGGPPLDIANCAVLCRSCNSTKGASEPVSVARVASLGIVVDADRGGVPHVPTCTLPDRGSHRYARGRVSRNIPVVADARWLRCDRARSRSGDGFAHAAVGQAAPPYWQAHPSSVPARLARTLTPPRSSR